jgi:phosphoglucosamine mutase
MMVDASGQTIDGDALIYVIAKSRLAAGALDGPVVGTLMSNLGLEVALGRLGVAFERTKVGDRYIMEQLKQTGGILGGEPSGHIICRDRTSTGDGIVAALQVLAALSEQDCTLAEATADVERYPQVLVNVRLQRRMDPTTQPKVQAAVEEAEQALAGQGRVLLRASGTEPVVRVMVEGMDPDQVQRLAEHLADTVRDEIGA